MRYLDGVGTNSPIEPDNPLIVGQAVHTGIEKSLADAVQEYYFNYPIITDEHINEVIKLETVIPLARGAIPRTDNDPLYPEGVEGRFEVEISDKDFNGFIDYLFPLYPSGDGIQWFDIYDFKYSNNISGYKESAQLHLYKYFFERDNPGKKIRNMYFLFVPKVSIRQKKTESLQDFRERLKEELSKVEVKIVQIEFSMEKVLEFLFEIKAANEETEFPRETSYLCRYCEYQEYCEKGWNYFMRLPENKRRNIEAVTKRVIWIYGVPFCGKTTFANEFPDPLMLNTDGNYRFVDAPVIPIKDDVRVEGRQTKRTLAWEVFKDTVAELEKKDNTFKTIIVDLLEDLYEHCRLYMYQQMGITHESDDSFRAWDKVRGEFLNTLKKLMNLDYENIILISHEDTTKDITKKGGDKITAIKPNLQDKVANKVAGMVDVVARIVADDEVRTFNFKSNEVIFGGGRLRVNAKDIPLDVDALFAVYDEANANAAAGKQVVPASTTAKTGRSSRKKAESLTTDTDKPQEASKTSAEGNRENPADKFMDIPAEEREETLSEDMYFYHAESDSYWMAKKGDPMPKGIDAEISVQIDKKEYESGIAKQKKEETSAITLPEQSDPADTEKPQEEKPRRRRRARE